MADIPEWARRRMIGDDLRAIFEAKIEERVSRYMEVSRQDIIPNHHFAAASTQCIELYRDGYFLSAVMVTQAVAEGIRKFVVERNKIKCEDNRDGPAIVNLLVKEEIISKECASAFNQIYRSHRADVHHMNPEVAEIPFPSLAKRNIQDLATIEREIFAFDFITNTPRNPKYWDAREDGKIGVFLRLEP